MTRTMSFPWRCCFYLLGACALMAIGYAAYGLAGYPVEAGRAELIVALVFGLAAIPFVVTGLRHARIVLTDDALTYLGFGLWCSPRTVKLEDIEKFGVGQEKSSGGGTEDILLLELRDGRRASIKVAMYNDHRAVVEALGNRLGIAETATRTGFTGARLDDG